MVSPGPAGDPSPVRGRRAEMEAGADGWASGPRRDWEPRMGANVRDSEAELGGDGGIGGSGFRHGLEHVAFTPSNIYRCLPTVACSNE
jgi:hypothetical protein